MIIETSMLFGSMHQWSPKHIVIMKARQCGTRATFNKFDLARQLLEDCVMRTKRGITS